MRKYILAGGSFALLAVVLGAFASHALKAHFSTEVLASFETGIRYMMYHGLALLILSQLPLARNPLIFRLFFWGVILFSFSIFVLCLGKLTSFDFSFMGPITPIGGSLLIAGWAVFLWKSFKEKTD
tara:strand:- start:154 stop:531 length:378 start_codon:yes stop_codon:yes gene_type:complete